MEYQKNIEFGDKMKNNRKKLGKQNLEKGRRFENKVRKDLESRGWIVSRWQNNVEFVEYEGATVGNLIPARQGKFRKTSTGFPDFIIFKPTYNQEVWGVECKVNGYLTKEEKEKAIFYLENRIFKKFIIAMKKNKKIVYKTF